MDMGLAANRRASGDDTLRALTGTISAFRAAYPRGKPFRKADLLRALLLLTALAILPPAAAIASVDQAAGEPSSQAFLETLDPAEREWLLRHPVVRVGGPLAFQPFHFHDERGWPRGMALDYLRLVLRTIGLEMRSEPPTPWPETLRKARDGEIDLIACAAKSGDREQYLHFSEPLLSFPLVIIGRSDGPFISGLDDLRGLKVTVVRGNVTAEWLARDGIAFAPHAVSTPLEALEAVSLGKADAHIENLAAAAYLIESHGLANLKIAAPTPYGNYDLHVAVRKDWPELTSIINKALRAIDPKEASAIRREWLSVRYEHGISPRDVAKWAALAGLPVLVVMTTLLVGYRRLRREMVRRRRTEQALAASERRFRELIRNSWDSVTVLAEDGRQVFVSDAVERMLGFRPEELTNIRVMDEMLHPEDRQRVTEAFVAIIRDGRGGAQYRHRHRDGSWVHLESLGTNQLDNPDIRGIVVNVRDITERKKAEEQMRAALDSLREAKAAAEAANVAKSEFLANMSHEIRTPVNGVMGMLQILLTTSLDADQAAFTAKALQSCRRLADLLGDILDLSRIEAGKLALNPAPMAIPDVFGNIADLFRAVAQESGVELRFQTDPSLTSPVLGDAARLQQILVNLVGNALKFTQAGSVTVEAQSLPPTRPGMCRILFSVTATGIGIPDDKLPLLFRPFAQAHEGYARAHQGAGLGLSICKRLVDLMGGSMTVVSEEGLGTTIAFSLSLPAHASRPRPVEAGRGKGAPGIRGRRILLAEDDPVSAMACMTMLGKHGADATHVQDGRQALETLGKAHFDLVLMDVQMPLVDGVEATRAIRAGQAGEAARDIPIIAMTAYAMAGDRERFLDAGMNAYLAKPLDIADLLEAIRSACRD
jgi:PAS domain S-box-containing protein